MREGCRLWVNDALIAFLGLDEAHPKLVQEIVDELRFRVEKVALGLFLEHAEDLDHLPRSLQVRSRLLAGVRIGNIAKMHGGRRRQRQDEAREVDARAFLMFRVVHFGMLA